MISITFVEHNGTRHTVSAEEGLSAMEVAVINAVPGIIAICGGNCSCATCHCYIPEVWQQKLTEPRIGEKSLLTTVSHVQPNSRLSCQIVLTPDLDGMEIQLPIDQGD